MRVFWPLLLGLWLSCSATRYDDLTPRKEPYHYNMTAQEFAALFKIRIKFLNSTAKSCTRYVICPHSFRPKFNPNYEWECGPYLPIARDSLFGKIEARSGGWIRNRYHHYQDNATAFEPIVGYELQKEIFLEPQQCYNRVRDFVQHPMDVWIGYHELGGECVQPIQNLCGNTTARLVTLHLDWTSTFTVDPEYLDLPLDLYRALDFDLWHYKSVMPDSFQSAKVSWSLHVPEKIITHYWDDIVAFLKGREFHEVLHFGQVVSVRVLDVVIGDDLPSLPPDAAPEFSWQNIALLIVVASVMALALLILLLRRRHLNSRRGYQPLPITTSTSDLKTSVMRKWNKDFNRQEHLIA